MAADTDVVVVSQKRLVQDAPTTRYTNTKNFIGGGVSGVIMVALGHPLDTVKVRLQTQAAPVPGRKTAFTGTFDCFRQTVKHEGVRGLYKGVAAPLTIITPLYALSFFGYGLGKQIISGSADKELSVAQHIIAGGFSGIFTATVATPGERVKCLMQIQRESKTTARYSSSFDCAVKLYKEGGIRNVCKGAYATLLRDVISGAGFFGIYYWVRPKLRSRNASKEDISIPAVLIAGGLAGAGCSIACLPADVVKSRVQTAPEGTRTNIATIFVRLLKEGGIRSLYKGVTPIMLRGFIGNAGGFLGYEYTIKVLNKLLQ